MFAIILHYLKWSGHFNAKLIHRFKTQNGKTRFLSFAKKAELNIFFLNLSKLSFNNLQKLNCRTDSVNRDILWNLIVLIDDHFPRDSLNRRGGFGGRRGGSSTPDDDGVAIRAMSIQNTPLISKRTSKIQIWNASSPPSSLSEYKYIVTLCHPHPSSPLTRPPVPCCEVS